MVQKTWRTIVEYQSLLWLMLLWELVVIMGFFPERLFPSLFKVIEVIWDFMVSGLVWSHLGVTVYRVLMGFFLAALVGVPLGLLMSRFSFFNDLMQPIFSVGYPIPRVALYPIFVLIFGIGSWSKISIIFLECLFPIVINTYFGALRTNHLLIWAAQNMGADQRTIFWKVLLPSTMPSIFTGFRIALPIGVVIAVLTEMIGATTGMGYLLGYMSASMEQARVLACIVIVALTGYVLDLILKGIQRKFVFWN